MADEGGIGRVTEAEEPDNNTTVRRGLTAIHALT